MSKVTAAARDKLDPERWQQLKSVLADALEQKSHAERTAVIANRCSGDETLFAEAASLLEEAEALLNEPHDTLEDCAEQATVALWQDESPRAGWRIGAYVVVRELGRGGMGTVYLASRADGQFEKEVAIKVLKRGTDTDEVLRRFAGERHILARLDHPNIAHLLDAGTTDDGLPYFVMEYVAGAPVTRYAREHELSIEQRLAIFLKVCSAVEVAHHNHVIHRDLKPGNILVNAEGEPKLLDFGIAKLLGPGTDCLEITAAGEERLTPNCASPEQTDGRPVTEASDVYALGALLYELLTAQKPHQFSQAQPTRDEIVRVIREEEPAVPSAVVKDREVARHLRGDLDAIVSFAMRKEPDLRYATVADFAADVRRHLAHEPVQARKGSSAYRIRSLTRSRSLRRIAAVAALLLVIALATAFWKQAQTRQTQVAGEPAKLDRKSIAVLPFENFGNENPSYFADGVQDNILTDLGRVGDLKVVSRNAVAAYRGKEKNARAIGHDLAVGSILVGSVQRSGDRVRINAQLIDTTSDTQIWAEHYDRKVEDIFSLQSELAQTIASQLQATLSSGEKAAIWKQPTQDLAAYDLYLRAHSALYATAGPEPQPTWMEVTKLLAQTIEKDPNFTLAYCLLNDVDLMIYRFGDDHSPERLAAAKQAAETALRLDPHLEEARLAMARYYYNGLNDYRQTEVELAKIPGSSPHTVDYYTLASLVERRLGRWEDSNRDGRKAIELDPNNPELAVNLCQTLNGLRRYDEATQLANETIAKRHGVAPVRLLLVKYEAAYAQGDLKEARAALEQKRVRESSDYDASLIWLLIMERNYDEARAQFAKLNASGKEMARNWLMLGTAEEAAGNVDAARAAYAEAARRSEAALALRPDDSAYLADLGEAQARLGMKEEAVRNVHRSAELMPTSADALVAPQNVLRVGLVEGIVGNRDAAFAKLVEATKEPFGVSYGDLKLNPMWDFLRDDPRFDQLLAAASVPF
ncbi:MAG: protein kinase domain-containing protein [Chthoniobacterales bacterium]